MQEANARKQSRSNGPTDTVVDLEELNIVEFPLAVLARHVPNGQKTIEFQDTIRDESTGERLQRTLLISASDSSNLPNWWDQDVLVALQVLTNRKNGFGQAVVEFSIYELLKLMALPNDGKNRLRVAKSLDNWQGVRFKYSHWRKGDAWLHPSAFCLIQDYNLSRTGRRSPDSPQVFTWSRIFFESVQASHTKPFDADFYFSLDLPTSRRMYRFLDKRLWSRPTYSYSLAPFCTEKLGMSRNYKPSEYARKMMPGYAELVGRGFLAEIKESQRVKETGHGSYQVEFRRGQSRRNVFTSRCVPPTETGKEATELEKELMARGIHREAAAKFAAEVPEAEIRKLVEYTEERRRANPKSVEDPTRFLAAALHRRYSPPASFETRAEKAAKTKARRDHQEQLAQQERSKKAAEEQAASERESRLRDYLDSLLPLEREALEKQAMLAAPSFTRQLHSRAVKDGSGRADFYRDLMLFSYIEAKGLHLDGQ